MKKSLFVSGIVFLIAGVGLKPTIEVVYVGGKDEDVFTAKLSEIEAIDADSETTEAIADWHYWIARGYKF